MPPPSSDPVGLRSVSLGASDHGRGLPSPGAAPHIPDYGLLRLIGRGSYGDVWLARGVTGLFRAVKVVRRERFGEDAPFEREFRGLKEFAAISLGESIQLALLHVGKNDAEGFFYYVMELADDAEHGRTIDPETYVPLTLAELRRRRGRIPAPECLELARHLARELASLHHCGLIHRDIKPSNVVLVGGVPKLADIGLIAPIAAARTFIGTEGFVPPEGPGTASADVFALGRLVYELCTGRDRNEFPQLPEDVARLPDTRDLLRLNDVILRACDPYPAARYHDGSELLRDLERISAGRRVRRSRRALVLGGAAAGVALAGAAFWWSRTRAPVPPPPAVSASPAQASPRPEPVVKSIAVLSFANLSGDAANGLLADGIQEDVINRLALIRELRVVSRTSSNAFRESRKSATELGQALGVGHLLEGTLRRDGDRVRVTARLVDAGQDRQIWSESYERSVGDLFSLQGQLASAIAATLSAVVQPETQLLIESRPTTNIPAYEAYVKGRQAMEWSPVNGPSPVPFLEEAVKLDPKFAAAWCELVDVYSSPVFTLEDTSPAQKAKAAHALEQVRRLTPGTPALLRAEGIYTYLVQRDFPRARRWFEQLQALQPNDPSVYFWLGSILMRERRWKEFLENRRRASQLDPANRYYSYHYRHALGSARRYEEMNTEQKRISALWPGVLTHPSRVGNAPLGDQLNIATVACWRVRDHAPLENFVTQCPPELRESPAILWARLKLAWFRRDYATFKELEHRLPETKSNDPPTIHETNIEFAAYYFSFGDREGGVARLRDTPQWLRSAAAENPGNAQLWATLGLVEAMLGNRETAVAAAKKSVQLLPEEEDPGLGTWLSASLACTYAWAGEKELALAELTRLLASPAIGLSGEVLRTGFEFAPLRGDPRFESLANDPKNDAPLF